MPILNYTTTIDSKKTVLEIQAILAEHGASSVTVYYDTLLQPIAVTFTMLVGGSPVSYRLDNNWKGIQELLKKDRNVRSGLATTDQAKRVGWRIVKDWVEAQLAYASANQASLPQLFLPYAVSPNGTTFYQEFEGWYKLNPGN